MKIIGYTVGTPLPKPNLKQTDPTKGDYVKGKEVLDEKYIKVDEQELTDEQKAQVRTNVDAVSMTEAEALTDSVAFIDVEDNENVDVPDSDVSNIVVDSALSTSSANPVQNKVITEKINEITSDIETLNNSIENLPAGETVQSDWNQNDQNAPDYIKNRPFYDETEMVTYLEPYTFNASSNAGWVQLPFSDADKVVVGTVLTVLWDGKTYECVASSDEGISREFGNAKLRYSNGNDTGEPFHITINSPTYYVCVAETGEHTVSVVGYETVPKKIDPKYLPEWNDIENVPFGEKAVETSVEGMTIGDFPVATSEAAHNLNVPLALGQTWSIYKNDGSLEGTFEVQEDEDGRLFICGSPVKITADTIECNAQWVRMLSVQRIYIVGVSGTTVETTVKKIDQKYLPGAMIVKLTFDSDGTTLLADKTYAEVKAAIDAGAVVRMLDTDGMTYLDVDFMSGMIARFSKVDINLTSSGDYIAVARRVNLYSYTTDITDESTEFEMTRITS